MQNEMPEDLRQYAAQLFPNLPAPISSEELMPAQEEDEMQLPEEGAKADPDLAAMDEEIEKQKQAVESQVQPPLPMQQSSAPNIAEMIRKQEQEEDRLALWKAGSRMAAAIAGAGSGTKIQADLSPYEDMQKRVERPLKNLLLKQELEQNQAKNDPNSEISKLARKSLAELGMDMLDFEGVPFSQIEKMYPTLAQSLYVRVSAQAKVAQAKLDSENKKVQIMQQAEKDKLARELKERELEQRKQENQLDRELKKQENQLNRDLKKEVEETNRDNKKFQNDMKVAQSVDRVVAQMQKSESFKGYNSAKEADFLLTEAMNAKDVAAKIQKAAAFMRYAKTAQGDSSVVRNEDMKVLAGNMGYTNVKEMLNKLAARAEGGNFTDAELNAMRTVVQRIAVIKRKELARDYINPLKKKASVYNYDLSESISPDLIREMEEDQAAELSPIDQIKKKQKENEEKLNKLKAREEELLKKQG